MICAELIVPTTSLSPKLAGKCIHPFVQQKQQQQQKWLPNHLWRLKTFNKSDQCIHGNYSRVDEFFKKFKLRLFLFKLLSIRFFSKDVCMCAISWCEGRALFFYLLLSWCFGGWVIWWFTLFSCINNIANTDRGPSWHPVIFFCFRLPGMVRLLQIHYFLRQEWFVFLPARRWKLKDPLSCCSCVWSELTCYMSAKVKKMQLYVPQYAYRLSVKDRDFRWDLAKLKTRTILAFFSFSE